MALTFADGTSKTQWCNGRLWVLYRGTSVGPNVLQSLLMALERWLLEFAEVRPHELDAVLLHLLKTNQFRRDHRSCGKCGNRLSPCVGRDALGSPWLTGMHAS